MAGLLFAVLVVDGEILWVFSCWQKGNREMVGGALFWFSGLD